MEKTGCKIIYGAPTTLAVKGLIMMMVIILCLSHYTTLLLSETDFSTATILSVIILNVIKFQVSVVKLIQIIYYLVINNEVFLERFFFCRLQELVVDNGYSTCHLQKLLADNVLEVLFKFCRS